MSSSQLWFGVAVLAVFAVFVWRSGAAAGSGRPGAEQLRPQYEQGSATFLDVRTAAEWNEAHLQRALHLPLDEVQQRAATLLPDRQKPVIVYCRSGARAQAAAQRLREMGYADVVAMRGGLADLQRAGYPLSH